MLYCLNLVKQYTNIEIDFKNALEEFNMLNKYGLLDMICNTIPERELQEFQMILDMTENDVVHNEYEIHSFISNQIDRFGNLFGHIVKPAFDKINDIIKNMDEKTIEKMLDKTKGIDGLKDKFNIVK